MSTINVLGGLNGSGLKDKSQGPAGGVAWSNVQFQTSPPVGNTPIELMLRLMISTGKGTNWSGTGQNYDHYEAGIGLGIPYDQIDIASFTAIQEQLDWDVNQQLFFMITEPESAREFIEDELCKPFGMYLTTGNDGRIRLVRPRHPQKFYVGDANCRLSVRIPPSTGTVYTGVLNFGVFDATAMCANISAALTATGESLEVYSCSYSPATHKFAVSRYAGDPLMEAPFDLVLSADNGWQSLGWTAGVTNTISTTADTARGAFIGTTLTKDDLGSVRVIENLEERVTSVVFAYDYDAEDKIFGNSRAFPEYLDPAEPPDPPDQQEFTHLDDTHGRQDYFVPSRGLISTGTSSASWVRHWKAPLTGCVPTLVLPQEKVGLNADTWAKLCALTLLDRYRHAPIKFRATLKWKWNTLEVGDVVRVTYDVPGTFVDHERNTDTLVSRLFEVVGLHPNFNGSIEATFLGHRYVSY